MSVFIFKGSQEGSSEPPLNVLFVSGILEIRLSVAEHFHYFILARLGLQKLAPIGD